MAPGSSTIILFTGNVHTERVTSIIACGVVGEGRVTVDGDVAGPREESTCSHEINTTPSGW